MNEGSELKDKKYCSRGLEGYTTVGVDTEKENNWFLAIFDEEDAIAKIYCSRACSSSCQGRANIVGLGDHHET